MSVLSVAKFSHSTGQIDTLGDHNFQVPSQNTIWRFFLRSFAHLAIKTKWAEKLQNLHLPFLIDTLWKHYLLKKHYLCKNIIERQSKL